MSQYFNNFPKITYNNILGLNITARAGISDLYKQYATNFYPYTISDGETADSLANDYYGSPNYDWIIYFCNNIIDPYYDWPLGQADFQNYIAQKYQSAPGMNDGVLVAQTTIAYYQQNPIVYYLNNSNNTFISANNYNPQVQGYNYTKMTQVSNLVKAAPVYAEPGTFSCTINGVVLTGNGTVFSSTIANGHSVYVNIGTTSNGFIANYTNALGVVTGIANNTSLTISPLAPATYTANTLLYQPGAPAGYTAVSVYTDEYNKNENKKFIELVDNSYVAVLENQLRALMNGQ